MKTRLAFGLCCSLFLSAGVCSADPAVFEVDRDFYPLYPSLIKFIDSGVEFNPPEVCGECHPQQYEEWTGSLHAMAFKDPVYQGELVKAVHAVGHDIARQCEGCHSPAGVVMGEVKDAGLRGLSSMAINGVSCDICHSIIGTTHWQTPSHEPENGSFVLAPGEKNKQGATTRVKRGPFAPEEGCGGDFHECRESSLHLRAELCASCHQVYHYEKHFPLESTYEEWKHGPYAQHNILCQDCHMVDTETFINTADTLKKPAKEQYHHYFNGANYLIYYLTAKAAQKEGNQELYDNVMHKYDMAVARLKAAADLEVTPVYRNGALAEIKVRVINRRAGHNLPTSLTNVRQMWLEIVAKDEKERVLLTSGILDKDGHLTEETRLFNSDGMGNDFHFSMDPWVVTSFSRHETIPPRGYKDVYYGINPQGGNSVTIEAKLRYRQADQKVGEKLLAAVPKDIDLKEMYGIAEVPALPVVDMVVKTEHFAVSGN